MKVYAKSATANIRQEANTSAKVLGVLTKTPLELIELTNEYNGYRWAKVLVSGVIGYVREDVLIYIQDEDGEERLSKHVTVKEFLKSAKAKALGVVNTFTKTIHKKAAKDLLNTIFEPARLLMGGIAMYISSGYRSALVNKAVGGAKGSQHEEGEAVDVTLTPALNLKLFHVILEVGGFDQLIAEFPVNGKPSWIHFSRNYIEDSKGVNISKQRGQVLIATKNKAGKTVYLPYKGNEHLLF